MTEPTPPTVPAGAIASDSPVPAGSALPRTSRGVEAYVGILLITIPTLVAGFLDVLLNDEFTLVTGLTLLASTVVAAFLLRRGDRSIAVITPPLAFFLTTVTAGQFTVAATGDLLLKQGLMIVTTLAFAAPWIVGSVVAAAVIVGTKRAFGR